MASACVNNIGMSPESFLDCPSCPSYGWLSPRISFSRDASDDGSKIAGLTALPEDAAEKPDLDAAGKDLIDFEFRLDDPVTMLPADELFSDGKLVPLQLAAIRPASDPASAAPFGVIRSVRSPGAVVKSRLTAEISGADQYVFSPKAPRCSSRWRELLGLKKIQNPKPELQKSASVPTKNPNPKSLKHFLHRSTKSSLDSSLSLPLLRDSDSESVSISSRLSLSSSSSSGPDHEDLPRLSLDSEKPNPNSNILPSTKNPPRLRIKPRPVSDPTVRIGRSPMRRSGTPSDQTVRIGRSPMRRPPESTAIPARGVSVDSPRMNSSGKIVFQSLERSSSSPSSFNGGSRNGKIRGMERSYSSNVRITPVLNVPVCSLRGSSKGGSVFGFGQLFSPQKREGSTGSTRGQGHHRSRNDRI